jgi:hypothetical protein
VIAKINAQRALPAASAGEKVPLIQGVSLKDGHPAKVDPETSSRLALLFFREGCHFCAANWKNWDGLFGDNSLNVDVVFVTSDKTLSQSYRELHPLLQQESV